MSTTWRDEQGNEWGKGVQTVITKGTEWGAYHRPVEAISQNIDPNTPLGADEGSTGLLEAPETTVEPFACRFPGCTKVAKSAAGLAAHARSH